MFAIGDNELDEAESIGTAIVCPVCRQQHKIEYGEEVLQDGTTIPSKMLAFYRCGESCYLAGIKGKSILSKREAHHDYQNV
jgi:hypothetical protein